MKPSLPVLLAVACVISGCGNFPYRTEGFQPRPECKAIYDQYEDSREVTIAASASDSEKLCWKRSIEERGAYDLLFTEFDDQGWLQGSSKQKLPVKDHLDFVFDQLDGLRDRHKERGLALVVFVHGWHHNADANDTNVRNFRGLLRDLSQAEHTNGGRRVVGIYVGWRGESLTIPWLNELTLWDRKNTAEKVAQGSVREFFAKLDAFRDRPPAKDEPKKIRLLTIGHSFGGLITFESLSSEFLRAGVRADTRTGAKADGKRPYLSRQGDLVVIVNPAFEGTRYEPLRTAGLRLGQLNSDQLPVVIVATSTADEATGTLFPIARVFNTLFESDPDEEKSANTRTVGHNNRYTTHLLAKCGNDECRNACKGTEPLPAAAAMPAMQNLTDWQARVGNEQRYIRSIHSRYLGRQTYLCGDLQLTSNPNWLPPQNPFWVVETSGDIMDGHNDIFNPNFLAFIRQMYLAVVAATDGH